MSYTIPVKASLADKDELAALLSNLKAEAPEASIKTTESSGLAMDPATVALIFDTVKVIVPALITALATIWVEHMKNKKQPGKPEKRTDVPKPSVVIETDAENIRIVLDTWDIKASVERVHLPTTIEQITRIRLEG
jgi:hypothetical protein